MIKLFYFLIKTVIATFIKESINSDPNETSLNNIKHNINCTLLEDDVYVDKIKNLKEDQNNVFTRKTPDNTAGEKISLNNPSTPSKNINDDTVKVKHKRKHNIQFNPILARENTDVHYNAIPLLIPSLNHTFQSASRCQKNDYESSPLQKNTQSNMTQSNEIEVEDFCCLITTLFKNAFYYRFNLQKIFSTLQQLPKLVTFTKDQQKEFLLEFIVICLNFVSEPEEFIKTDDLIYNVENKDVLHSKRQFLLDKYAGFKKSQNIIVMDNDYQLIAERNKELEKKNF